MLILAVGNATKHSSFYSVVIKKKSGYHCEAFKECVGLNDLSL